MTIRKNDIMHNPESLLESETQKFLYDFKTQTDHLIPAGRLNIVIVNKKRRTCQLKQSEKKDKYLDLAR